VSADEDLVQHLARRSGLRRVEVRRFLEMEVISVSGTEVDEDLVRRLRRARRLRRDLGFPLDAVVIIQRLLDRLEALEGRSTPGWNARMLDEPSSPEAGDR
jgi:hypothetical protein